MVKLANTVHLISVFLCVLFFGDEKKLIKNIAHNMLLTETSLIPNQL